jgi:hypothetical protein
MKMRFSFDAQTAPRLHSSDGTSWPLGFSSNSRASLCFGRINMRSFLSSPLVVVGKGHKLTRNRSVGHGFGSAEQSLCCLQIFLASL